MADQYNEARAMRVAEIITDFRNLQYYLATLEANPPAEDYYLEGYALLRACIAEGQSVLVSPYEHTSQHPSGNPEHEKAQLKLIILDASTRRFQCQRAYMRALAAQRWVNARMAILQGGRAHSGNAVHLQALDAHLRTEIGAITDTQVEYTLRSNDVAQGKWIADDPSLAAILQQLHLRQ